MTVRAALFVLASALILSVAGNPALASRPDRVAPANASAARDAEARALRDQIAHLRSDLRLLEARQHELDDGVTTTPQADAEKRALATQIAQMHSDQQLLEARLRELGSDTAASAAQSAEPPSPALPSSQPAREIVAEAPAPPAPAPPPPPQLGPALRSAADPAPYLAAVDGRVGMFRIAFSPYRYVPIGARQLVVYNTYDEIYLLDLADDCPGLLTTTRFQIENFSTHVTAGKHAVIADGQRCPIADIREIRPSRLPRQ